jgi:soluble lytic murein transglycosylase
MKINKLLSVGMLLCLGASAQVRASDSAVKDAAEGFRLGELGRVTAALPQVRGHVLESYVEYWALRLPLISANGEAIERFLEKHKGTAVADRMRTDWLKQLGKSERWDEFARVGAGFESDDPELQCLRATHASRNGASDVSVPVGVWADRITEACAQAFAALAEKNRVTTEDAVWRFRSAAEGGTSLAAERVAQALPDSARPIEDQIRRAASPMRCCDRAMVRSRARNASLGFTHSRDWQETKCRARRFSGTR